MIPVAEPIAIRPADRGDLRACRVLLPQTKATSASAEFVVAADEAGRVVGAASLAWDAVLRELKGWEVDVHVIPPVRGAGVGRALVSAAIERAREKGIARVHAREWVETGSAGMRFWERCGFRPAQAKQEFEATLQDILEGMAGLVEGLKSRGRVPAEARVVPLMDADARAVAALHVAELGGTIETVLPLVDGSGAHPYDRRYSFVLTLGGQVIGFTLGRREAARRLFVFDANVILPHWRKGWASPLLRYEAGKQVLASGVDTVRYYALDGATDTLNAHRRVRAKLVRTAVCMGCDCMDGVAPENGVAREDGVAARHGVSE